MEAGRWLPRSASIACVVVEGSGYRTFAWDGTDWLLAGSGTAVVDPDANTVAATIPWADLGAIGPRWRAVGVAGLALPGDSWLDGSGPIYDLAYVRDTSTSNFQSNVQAAILAGTGDASAAVATIDVADVRTATSSPCPSLVPRTPSSTARRSTWARASRRLRTVATPGRTSPTSRGSRLLASRRRHRSSCSSTGR